ncbi:PAS domain S-box protein [Halopenitus persicus]|uniref:histidine kinase n=1 Tax=Halopenitus persicus TaxID=1048396 RepID=A0A1H3HPX1_9EURY|nr:PAS domain S-box protein [Halopenitus persicus]QHS15886.1 PAS domain S-box protein [haloarchaeon 3A1-DGR]SDY17561.1 PAS domain S-box-containing protein [Halopenitus persicus]
MDATGEERESPRTVRSFREAVESAGHSIYWTDTTGTIEYVNPAFEEQTGYTAAEAVGNNANILQSGVHDDRFYERLWDTILAGETWEGEIINQRKDGERYAVKQTISPVTDETGEIVRFVAINEDVTDLRESQEQLKRQRDRLADLFDAVPVPLVLVDLENGDPVVKQVNRRFTETFGYAGTELGGSSLDAFIADAADADRVREINDRLQRGDRVRREVTRTTADGDRRTFLFTGSPLGEATDEVLATYIDVTDRKRATEKLERKTQELERKTETLEEFASVVSHDLRNPLNVAMGHLDILAAEHDDLDVEPIRRAHARMQELIENVLMLAKQGRRVDEVRPVPVADCARESWDTVETTNARLRIEGSRTVQADRNRLRQLFGNLFRNAVEHGATTSRERPSGTDVEHGDADVTITVGATDDGFYVEDDGPGIPEEERGDVFQAGHTTADDGTGLGLSIVQEIVEAHGWTIAVTEGTDGGARFEITDVNPDA